MKGLFSQYDCLAPSDYTRVWSEALFVFDANVLLNLYRYHQPAQHELLNVLSQLSDRIWIPHHVAIEFQRNRLKVIADQANRFSEVSKAINAARATFTATLEKLQLNERHSTIDPRPLLTEFNQLVDKFLEHVEKLKGSHQSLREPDPLKERLENLFDSKVGNPPHGQETINKSYKEAERRYAAKIPPGYMDADKSSAEYLFGSIVYQLQYGDFLVWQQLLSHAKESGEHSVIFVTDDNKEDWWYRLDANGPQTIGPRPELIEEAREKGDITSFLMYSTANFLEHAVTHLRSTVSTDTLSEVRNVSETASRHRRAYLRHFEDECRRVVREWIADRLMVAPEEAGSFIDFLARRGDQRLAFKVLPLSGGLDVLPLDLLIAEAHDQLQVDGFNELSLVFVADSVDRMRSAFDQLAYLDLGAVPSRIRIVIGVRETFFDGRAEFVPYRE